MRKEKEEMSVKVKEKTEKTITEHACDQISLLMKAFIAIFFLNSTSFKSIITYSEKTSWSSVTNMSFPYVGFIPKVANEVATIGSPQAIASKSLPLKPVPNAIGATNTSLFQ